MSLSLRESNAVQFLSRVDLRVDSREVLFLLPLETNVGLFEQLKNFFSDD